MIKFLSRHIYMILFFIAMLCLWGLLVVVTLTAQADDLPTVNKNNLYMTAFTPESYTFTPVQFTFYGNKSSTLDEDITSIHKANKKLLDDLASTWIALYQPALDRFNCRAILYETKE